jgi:hypothetical protein
MKYALGLAWLGLCLPLTASAASGTREIGNASLAPGERPAAMAANPKTSMEMMQVALTAEPSYPADKRPVRSEP